jgi:FkbM family methyltransferase
MVSTRNSLLLGCVLFVAIALMVHLSGGLHGINATAEITPCAVTDRVESRAMQILEKCEQMLRSIVSEPQKTSPTPCATPAPAADETNLKQQFTACEQKLSTCTSAHNNQALLADSKLLAFPKSDIINYPFGITAKRYSPSISESWWAGLSSWERGTFDTFHKYINANTTVIDFGAWIGPTVLFAANLAKRVFAFECDPYAMTELSRNVLLNPHLSYKISLSSLCISDKRQRLKMSGAGGSGSTVESVSSDHFKDVSAVVSGIEWEVDCVPLEDIIAQNQITGDVFVKIDTEGAESFIVPSLKKWLESRRDHLPTLFVSMHSHFSHLETKPEHVNGWLEIMRMYENVMPLGEAPIRGSQWTAAKLTACIQCDIVMTI